MREERKSRQTFPLPYLTHVRRLFVIIHSHDLHLSPAFVQSIVRNYAPPPPPIRRRNLSAGAARKADLKIGQLSTLSVARAQPLTPSRDTETRRESLLGRIILSNALNMRIRKNRLISRRPKFPPTKFSPLRTCVRACVRESSLVEYLRISESFANRRSAGKEELPLLHARSLLRHRMFPRRLHR